MRISDIESVRGPGGLRAERAFQRFRVHLDGPKFQGIDHDRSRKDWIAVADVLNRVTIIVSVEPDVA
jgi:hypothetical protein